MTVLEWILSWVSVIAIGAFLGISVGLVLQLIKDRAIEQRHISDLHGNRNWHPWRQFIAVNRGYLHRPVLQNCHTIKLLWQQGVNPVPQILVGPLFEAPDIYRLVRVSVKKFTAPCATWRAERKDHAIILSVVHINLEHDVASIELDGVVLRAYLCRACRHYHQSYTRPWITAASKGY